MKQIVVRCNVKKDQNDISCQGIKRNNLIEELLKRNFNIPYEFNIIFMV